MEQYREKLKTQNWIMAISCLILTAFAFLAIGSELGWFHILQPATSDDHWRSAWYGYITGITCGVFAAMLACLIRNLRAMKDEKKLKALYVKAHDERTIQIQTLARNTAMQILLCVGMVATVIAGYYDVKVSITILVCTWISSSVNLLLISYYNKKF